MGCKGRHQSHARAPDSATRARCALIAAAGLKLMKSRTSFRCFLGTGKKRKEARAGWRVGEAKRRRRESREQGDKRGGPCLGGRARSVFFTTEATICRTHTHTHEQTTTRPPIITRSARDSSPQARARGPHPRSTPNAMDDGDPPPQYAREVVDEEEDNDDGAYAAHNQPR